MGMFNDLTWNPIGSGLDLSTLETLVNNQLRYLQSVIDERGLQADLLAHDDDPSCQYHYVIAYRCAYDMVMLYDRWRGFISLHPWDEYPRGTHEEEILRDQLHDQADYYASLAGGPPPISMPSSEDRL